MQEIELREIIEILSADREVFHYFKDRYAAMLLGYMAGKGISVRAVKESSMRGLLDKPHIREIVRTAHDGILTPEMFAAHPSAGCNAYVVTLGEWMRGDGYGWEYGQTSRRGGNLVVQLNFSREHDQQYRRLIRPDEKGHPFQYLCHPINRNGRHTLAWARIDLSLEMGEALIEEVQNDWLRTVLWRKKAIQSGGCREDLDRLARNYLGAETTVENFGRYCDQVLSSHCDIWDEAILAAAISFLVEKVGIRRIFYHTHEGGNLWKGISGRCPPKSLYTTLPRRFGFREVMQRPSFLADAEPRSALPVRRRGEKSRKRAASAGRTRSVTEEIRFFLLEL